MALYLKDGKVYRVDGNGKVHGVSVRGKDKVVTTRELESVSVVDIANVSKLPEGARPVTVDELVAKFAVSESNPLEYPKTAARKKAAAK